MSVEVEKKIRKYMYEEEKNCQIVDLFIYNNK